MSEKSKKVTMQDVARHAGVSYQTVSRVLNNSCNVSEQTREKIEKAIAQLKYVPNVLAQQLSRQTSNYIGLINVGSFIAPSSLASGLSKYIAESGYKLVIAIANELSFECIDKLIYDFKSQCIDKVIINVPFFNEDAIELNKKHEDIRLLFLDIDPFCPVFSVTFNPADGANAAIKHIKGLGHRNVAVISGPETSVSAQIRHKSYVDAINANGLNLKTVICGDWSCESGFAAAMQILYERHDISALFVANDQMAIGAIAALNERKISVPEDISVLGYDNTIDSAYSIPSLTTVNLDRDKQCRIAVDKILDENSIGMSSVLPTELIIRKSTGRCLNLEERNTIQTVEDILQLTNKLKTLMDK